MLAAVLLAGGAAAAGIGGDRARLIPWAGAVLVAGGAVLLAWFVLSGDPYVDGAMSRWSRRSSHLVVYAAWVASAVVAVALWREGRAPSDSRVRPARLMAVAAAVVVVQAVAAMSQDLN